MPNPAPTPAAPAATPPPAQPPAAAPAAPPAAAPAPASPPPQTRGSKLFKLLADEAGLEAPQEHRHGFEPKDDKKPEPAPDAAAPAPSATPPADDKPIKATKSKAIEKRPAPDKEQPAAPPAAPAPSAPATEADWEAQLVDEEKQLLEDAREAEKHLPARKGIAEQARKFVKSHQDYLEKHPDTDSDPDEKEKYDKWLAKNQPRLSDAEQREVSERRIAERVTKPWEEKYGKLEHEIFQRDREPAIRQEAAQVASQLRATGFPEEIIKFAETNGVEKAKAEYGEEILIANTIVQAASDDFRELVALDERHPKTGLPLVTPAADVKDPRWEQHQRLSEIIATTCEEFMYGARREQDLMRDGKWFCTRDEWAREYHKYPGRYWTFSNREIAQRMLAQVKPSIAEAIRQNEERMKARGYQRVRSSPPSPVPLAPPLPPQPQSAPSSRPQPVPAPTPGIAPAATQGARLASVLTAG
jgi:hypothetical protein